MRLIRRIKMKTTEEELEELFSSRDEFNVPGYLGVLIKTRMDQLLKEVSNIFAYENYKKDDTSIPFLQYSMVYTCLLPKNITKLGNLIKCIVEMYPSGLENSLTHHLKGILDDLRLQLKDQENKNGKTSKI